MGKQKLHWVISTNYARSFLFQQTYTWSQTGKHVGTAVFVSLAMLSEIQVAFHVKPSMLQTSSADIQRNPVPYLDYLMVLGPCKHSSATLRGFPCE